MVRAASLLGSQHLKRLEHGQPYVGNHSAGLMGLMASSCVEVPCWGTHIYLFIYLLIMVHVQREIHIVIVKIRSISSSLGMQGLNSNKSTIADDQKSTNII